MPRKVFAAAAAAIFASMSSAAYATSVGFLYEGGSFKTIGVPGAVWTEAYGLNNAGVVVGDYTPDGGGTYYGFRYFAGSLTTFGVPNAPSTIPFDINNAGQIVGYSIAGGHTSGFLYDGSTFTSLNVPGATRTWAYGINDIGQIVGAYSDGGVAAHGFVFQNGTYITLDRPSFASTGLLRINNSGQIAGFSNENIGGPGSAFLLNSGTFTELDVAGSTGSTAYGLTSNGAVLVQSNLGSFLLEAGGYSPLLSSQFEAFDINDNGQVAGRTDVLGVPSPIVGAGLPGLLIAIAGYVGWRRSRRGL